MNTQFQISTANISPATIEAVIRQARADRAETIRAMAVRLPSLFSRLAARLRPSRQRLPQAGVWAR